MFIQPYSYSRALTTSRQANRLALLILEFLMFYADELKALTYQFYFQHYRQHPTVLHSPSSSP